MKLKKQTNKRGEVKKISMKEPDVRKIVANLFVINPNDIISKARERRIVKVRKVYCYCLAIDLGISMTRIAAQFSVSLPIISKSVRFSRQLTEANGWQLNKHIIS